MEIVVASSVGGNPELVIDGENGALFSAGDETAFSAALRELLESAELRTKMGTRARSHVVESFGFEYHVAAFQELYLDLIQAHPTP